MSTIHRLTLSALLALAVGASALLLSAPDARAAEASRFECANSKCNGPFACNFGVNSICSFEDPLRCVTEPCWM
jgi:hypothetical protein